MYIAQVTKPCAAQAFGCTERVAVNLLACPFHWKCLPIGLRRTIVGAEVKKDHIAKGRGIHLAYAVWQEEFKSPCVVCKQPSMGRPLQCCSKKCRKKLKCATT